VRSFRIHHPLNGFWLGCTATCGRRKNASSCIGELQSRLDVDCARIWTYLLQVPISLYGFFVAATYIDVIAGLLVDCLEFIGVVSRVHSTVLGLTVLAFGNSVGDLTANLAMARKGMPKRSAIPLSSGVTRIAMLTFPTTLC